jgi:GntR family transcriptional regulator of vanillate catabolism
MSNRLNQVVRELRGLILRGDLKAGERITETAAADMLGVSRTPVRLALSILEHENLVDGETNRGFWVREFTAQDYENTLAVRATMDGMAARLAAQNGLADDIDATLNEVIEGCDILLKKKRFDSDDLQIYARWNATFHETVARASANMPLERLLERDMPLRFRSARLVFPFDPDRARELVRRSHDDHINILEAIRNREGTRAEYLMREHVEMPHRRAKKVVEEIGGVLSHDSVDIMVVAKPAPADTPASA